MSTAAPAFRAEADMLAAIARVPAALAGRRRGTRNAEVMFEFFGAEGTPDIVFLEFDQAELERREAWQLDPVLNFNAVAVLLALQNGQRSAGELAEALTLSRAHLQRSILPELEQRGWLESSGGDWRALHHIRPLTSWIVAVEAKRRDWRRAIKQAERYRRFANRSVVVLDGSVNVGPAAEYLESQGTVGLAALDAERGRVRTLLLPAWHKASNERDFIWAGEQAYAMRRAGVASGPVLPVFGRTLLATAGDDPRLAARPLD